MEMSFQTEGPICIARVLEPRIDAPAAIGFKEALRRGAADAPPRVVLDLSAVDFIDSSGLGAIIAVMKILSPERRLILAGLKPNVEKVLSLTRMDKVFEIHLTLEDALSVQRV